MNLVWCHVHYGGGFDESVPWLSDIWLSADGGDEDIATIKADMIGVPGIDMVLSAAEYQSAQELVAYLDANEIRRIPDDELFAELEYRKRSLVELETAADQQVLSWILLTSTEEPIRSGIARLEAEATRRRSYRAEGQVLAQSGITPVFVRDLKSRVTLSEFIDREMKLITLKRAGSVHQALCPYHAERTPSFTVYEDRFICFGCGAHGDVFDLCMQQMGVTSWRRAVEMVAQFLGISVPKPVAPTKPHGPLAIYEAYPR